MPSRRAKKPGYPLAVVLSLIAAIPLLGASLFAVREVLNARAEREAATNVSQTIEELIVLSELRASLIDEHNWTAVVGGVTELGMPTELASELTGVDIVGRLASAREAVGTRAETLRLESTIVRIDQIRTDPELGLGTRMQELLEVERELASIAGSKIDAAIGQAAGIGDGGALLNRLRVLEEATIARQAAADGFTHYFGARFATEEGVEQVMALNMDEGRRTSALARTARLADAGTATSNAIAVIVDSPQVAQVETEIRELLAQAIEGSRQDGSLANVLLELETIGSTVEAHTGSAGQYSDLVVAAGADASAASESAIDAASDRNRAAVSYLFATLLISVLIAVAATRIVAKPAKNLARLARRIRDGDTTHAPVAEAGPIEIRIAARAMNEAAGHLALAEAQAVALGQGDLDHEALTKQAPGEIGASLQIAVRNLASSMADRERMEEQIRFEAAHDPLTKLANRRASLEHLQRVLDRSHESGRQVALLFLDLDGFKDVNDRHGHKAGDTVLVRTAARLSEVVNERDLVGRLGGDEFVVIAESVTNHDEAMTLADKMRTALVGPMLVDRATVTIDASIGVATSEYRSIDAEELLHEADLAVYRAKGLGKGQVAVCDDDLRQASLERTELEQALAAALIDEEFVLYFQPIVEPTSAVTTSYEALIRWDRPGRGLLLPGEFLPVAERSGLIVDLDRWVIRAVVKQMVAWDARVEKSDVPVSINVSGRHLVAPSFVENVLRPIDEFGIDPGRIVIEVTETTIFNDLVSATAKLQQLRDRGVKVAIDDFGTGYSSLAHLRELPVDILKIDRLYTNDASSSSLVRLIIDTGHMMGVTVTAEGVETREQAVMLTAMGVDHMQGFLFAQPKPLADIDRDTTTVLAPSRTVDHG